MEDYKLRMIKEYNELKTRKDKLHSIIVQYKSGTLKFDLSCPIELLEDQESTMNRYLTILEARAIIEHIDLNT